MPDPQSTANRTVRAMTASILIAIVPFAFSNGLTGLLINDVVDTFSLVGTKQGLMSSMLSLGLMLSLFIAPMLQGRIKKLNMMLYSGFIMAVSLFVSGFAPMFPVLIAGCALYGIGSGWLDSYANSCMVDAHPNDSAKYLGYLHATFGIGSLLIPLIVTALSPIIRWRGIYYLTGGLMTAAMIVILLLTKRGDAKTAIVETPEKPLKTADIFAYLKNTHNILLLLAGAMAAASQTGLFVWIVRYMTVRHDAAALGTFSISLFWICATINRVFISKIRVDRMILFFVGAGLSALTVLIGVLVGSPILMVVMAGLTGLVTGHFMPVIFGECARGYEGNTTMTTSVCIFLMGIARTLTPLLIAFLSSVYTVSAGMLVTSALSLLTMIFSGLSIRYDRKHPVLSEETHVR